MALWSSTTTGDEAVIYGVKYYHTVVSSVGLCKKLTLWSNFYSLMVVWETRPAHKIHFKLHWSALYLSCCLTFSFSPLLAVVFKHFRNNTFPVLPTLPLLRLLQAHPHPRWRNRTVAWQLCFSLGTTAPFLIALSWKNSSVRELPAPRVSVRLPSIGNDTWAGHILCCCAE